MTCDTPNAPISTRRTRKHQVSLLCLQSFSSLILQSFQNVIERNIVIALFLTMLTGTAGNAGNQVG